MTTTQAPALKVRYFGSTGYAVADASGNLIEHHIATPEQAAERLTFHTERIAAIRAWDAAHTDMR